MGSSMAKKKRGRSIKTQLFLSFSPPSSPPSQSHLAHVRRPFNVRHAGVGKGTGNQRKGSEKEGRRSVVCFFFFFLIFHLALSSPRPSEKVEQVSFSPSLSPSSLPLCLSLCSLFSKSTPGGSTSIRRSLPRARLSSSSRDPSSPTKRQCRVLSPASRWRGARPARPRRLRGVSEFRKSKSFFFQLLTLLLVRVFLPSRSLREGKSLLPPLRGRFSTLAYHCTTALVVTVSLRVQERGEALRTVPMEAAGDARRISLLSAFAAAAVVVREQRRST